MARDNIYPYVNVFIYYFIVFIYNYLPVQCHKNIVFGSFQLGYIVRLYYGSSWKQIIPKDDKNKMGKKDQKKTEKADKEKEKNLWKSSVSQNISNIFCKLNV